MEQYAHLELGTHHHIFNRGIAEANIFLEERNSAYFLNLYVGHLEPATETFAYCLSRNHFRVDFCEYPCSSCRALLADTPTKLSRAQILERFGGRRSTLFTKP